jgi:hypothetical protein
LQKDNTELLRLRNEVGQLRRERDAQKQRAGQPPAGGGQSASHPGRYISKEQLAFAGYATPEAALESMVWAVAKGTYDQVTASIDPEVLKDESRALPKREDFKRQQERTAVFKGMQIVGRKTLDGDRVELKVKVDGEPLPNSSVDRSAYVIEPMVKVGNEWKSSFMERCWQPDWDNDGQIQSFAQ